MYVPIPQPFELLGVISGKLPAAIAEILETVVDEGPKIIVSIVLVEVQRVGTQLKRSWGSDGRDGGNGTRTGDSLETCECRRNTRGIRFSDSRRR